MTNFGKVLLSILITLYATINFAAESHAVNNDPMEMAVKQWVHQAFLAANNFDFTNYNQELTRASTYFTPSAWSDYKSGLDKSGVITMIIQDKLIANGVTGNLGSIKVAMQKGANGENNWLVTSPAKITYTGPGSVVKVQHEIVTMTIVNTTGTEGVSGMAIQTMGVKLP